MKMGMKVMFMAGVLLATASGLIAQDEHWDFEVTPYFWAAGIDGEATVQGNHADIDADFEDIIDAVDAGVGLMTTARRDSFVVWGQFDYVGMDTDELDDAPAGGSIQTDSFLAALAAGLRFDLPLKGSTIDVMAGLRYGCVKTEVEITGVGSGEDTEDLIDGIFVLRPNVRLTERWHFNPTFLVGAGDSELTWEVQPTIVYRINEDLALRAGYRRVFYDIEGNGGNGLELAFQGLLVGVDLLF